MFKYDKKQQVFEFGKIKVGGQPGEYPTVLVSTMFYLKHKIVTDENKGVFDKAKAEALWNTQEVLSDTTGLPYFNQLVAETPEAIKRYIDWFVEICDDIPFLVDSSDGKVRATAAKYATEIGVANRAIHNSINASVTPEEIKAIKDSDLDSAIILAFNATDPSVKGKLEILEKGGSGQTKGMLDVAKECGITRPLIDVAATPLGAGSGATIRSVLAIKGKLGLPVGGGFHNMASAWDWMKKFKKEDPEAKTESWPPVDIGTNLVAQIMGANFLLYGPIENVKKVFPAVAMVDIMLAETAKDLGLSTLAEAHPIKKLV